MKNKRYRFQISRRTSQKQKKFQEEHRRNRRNFKKNIAETEGKSIQPGKKPYT
jgi:hypothetical protein